MINSKYKFNSCALQFYNTSGSPIHWGDGRNESQPTQHRTVKESELKGGRTPTGSDQVKKKKEIKTHLLILISPVHQNNVLFFQMNKLKA